MKKYGTLIATGFIILSAIPFTLNIWINMFFADLDTEIYEQKKARVEQRRQIEKMFPELNTANPLRLRDGIDGVTEEKE